MGRFMGDGICVLLGLTDSQSNHLSTLWQIVEMWRLEGFNLLIARPLHQNVACDPEDEWP